MGEEDNGTKYGSNGVKATSHIESASQSSKTEIEKDH